MDNEKKQLIHICCAVPYRRAGDQIEFCLVRSPIDRAWEFPMAVVPLDKCQPQGALEQAWLQGQLKGFVVGNGPLGQFRSSRGDTHKEITAFLVAVTHATDTAEPAGRWCLGEEVKVRIRRKPMRRLVDLALRHLEDDLKLDRV